MRVRSRHHLRRDAVERITSTLVGQFGVDLGGKTFELVEIEGSEFDLVLVDGDPLVCFVDDEPTLTVQGANTYSPSKHTVTVDTGAISFVSDGADVMRPGIVDADEAIEPGDLVVIVEETHGKALAIGRSRVAGEDLSGDAGKVIDSIHHVGDELYGFTP